MRVLPQGSTLRMGGFVAFANGGCALWLLQGWEERIDASMTHLLRTSLAKTAKESAGVPPPLSMPPDTAKLKKHITYVCDRLSKGALLVRAKKGDKKGAAATVTLADGGDDEDDE